MSSRQPRFDAIIVGSGATGSWGAKELTEGGLRVLLLEAGNLPEGIGADCTKPMCPQPQAVRTSAGERQPIQSQCYAFSAKTCDFFVDDVDNPYETPVEKPFVWIRSRVVGGRTVLWHRVALRMSDWQFKAASLDGFGADWPICYADLEPHYERIERFLGVAGTKAHLQELPDGPLAPLTLRPLGQDFKRAVEEQWPDRHVTALRRAGSQPLGSCAPMPEAMHLPDDEAQYPWCRAGEALAIAHATGRLTLCTHSVAARVMTDREGKRAVGVEYVDANTGAVREAHAKVIVLCASTIETTRIMLNSVSDRHPEGLGNSNGLLGAHLTVHTSGVGVTGLRDEPCAATADLYIPNFRNRGGETLNFLRGYGIQGYIKPGPDNTTQCDLVCFGEMLPRVTNRVTLGATRDRWGIPAPHISCEFSDNELEMAEDQLLQARLLMQQAGFEVTQTHDLSAPGSSIHEVGTVRMGADPDTSILNPFSQCWDVPNVFVTDGAAFASVGFQNPTLTMMAVTARACQYILREFGRSRYQPFLE